MFHFNQCHTIVIDILISLMIFSHHNLGINTPCYINGIIEESPDGENPTSSKKTAEKHKFNRSKRRLSDVSKVRERARKIGIVRDHIDKKERAKVDGNHPIFPLTSTLVNNYIDDETTKDHCFFNELCPATQVMNF